MYEVYIFFLPHSSGNYGSAVGGREGCSCQPEPDEEQGPEGTKRHAIMCNMSGATGLCIKNLYCLTWARRTAVVLFHVEGTLLGRMSQTHHSRRIIPLSIRFTPVHAEPPPLLSLPCDCVTPWIYTNYNDDQP